MHSRSRAFVIIFALMTVVSSSLTFPNISWWVRIANAETVILDAAERFGKMSHRNRYRIAGANNAVLLTIPLIAGREQRLPMKEVTIYNTANWQKQHWRTLVSAYKRSPYFDHYEPELAPLFETKFELLTDFNRKSLEWVKRQIGFTFSIQEAMEYIAEYPADVTDLRNVSAPLPQLPVYPQVFEDRLGFIPDLSILDLLFMEGPSTASILRQAVGRIAKTF